MHVYESIIRKKERKSKSKAMVSALLGVLAYAAVIFLSAWKLFYWQGWLYLATAVLGTVLNFIISRNDDSLLKERMDRAKDGKDWDKKLLAMYFLLTLVSFIVAGLDSGRFHWSPEYGSSISLIGCAFMLAGQMLFAFAKHQNNFFSSTVRIQKDRGHTVCTTGLYSVIRHPGYLGMMISLIAFPVVLQSLWSALPAFLALVVLLVRTDREDKTLEMELDGYSEYMKRTKYRIIPFLY
jgi:protein-S-isoprenylcysteine O-methyltransferase Ste14